MSAPPPTSRPRLPRTWLQSERALARLVARPVNAFLHVEASGGILLVAATVVALVWANSPWRGAYDHLFHAELVVAIGSFRIEDSVAHAVNDGLMALFFFVVGLEIKREWVVGELRDRRAAVLPAVAALGGMVLPALIYVAVTAGSDGMRGWGIPMATDIAFVVGVVALLGRRVPAPIKVFLLTLAIVDDLGAIVVIAVFYAGTIDAPWLGVAVVGLGVVVGLRALGVARYLPYVVVGVVVWFATWQSGVHATMAGVVLALLTPVRPVGSATEPEPGADARDAAGVYWVEPRRRAILPLDGFHLSRSLARRIASDRFRVTVDTAFAEMVALCAQSAPDRPETWINGAIEEVFGDLHARGFAHSVECWDGDRLAGGLYGLALGRAFFGESMVSRATDASKVALAWLVARLRVGGFTLLDCQFMTEHLASLGAIEVSREDYKALLGSAVAGVDGGAGATAGTSAASGAADFGALDRLAGAGGATCSVSGPVCGKDIVQLLTHTS